MKIMHNPPIDIRVKFEEYLGNSRELVNLSYGSNNMDERRFYVGIAYMPVNDNTVDCYSPNRYDIVTYDAKEDIFECNYRHLDYAAALHFMEVTIRTVLFHK